MDRWRIITVCPDEETRQMVDEALGKDYDVLAFDNSTEALNALDACEPDLVIAGLSAQRVTEMIDTLESRKVKERTPVAVILHHQDSAAMAELYRQGAQLCLPRPDSPGRLLRNIQLLFRHAPPMRKRKMLSISELRARLEFLGDVGIPGALQLAG